MASSDSEEPEFSFSTRPNRWKGPASTWKALVEQERGDVAALDLIRNRDLSIHLFNSFALRKRAREAEQAQKEKEKEVEDVPSEKEGGVGKIWAPPKTWTAWPLPPEIVPREGETFGPADPDDFVTVKNQDAWRPSRELEEVMVGLTLKLAKERFEKRAVSEGSDDLISHNFDSKISRKSSVGQPGSDASDFEMSPDEQETDAAEHSPNEEPKKKILLPVVSTDDDRSHQIMRPSIRHTLSKLDDVLIALHYSRQICRKYGASSEYDTENENSARRRRRRSKSRTREADELTEAPEMDSAFIQGNTREFVIRSRPDHDEDNSKIANAPEAQPHRPKNARRGRPLKNYEALEGESQADYLIRLAKLQKRKVPSFVATLKENNELTKQSAIEPLTKRKRVTRATSPGLTKLRQDKLVPRDWSEVLGAAALGGFNPKVIARATQRCASLFGESMAVHTLVEAPFHSKGLDSTTIYQPEEIPDFSDQSQEGDPVAEEPASVKSDEEMMGAVHIDRYLRPLKKRRAVRNSQAAKRGENAKVDGQDVETGDAGGTSQYASSESELDE